MTAPVNYLYLVYNLVTDILLSDNYAKRIWSRRLLLKKGIINEETHNDLGTEGWVSQHIISSGNWSQPLI